MRVAEGIDAAVLRLADGAARTISRRKLMTRAGGFALAAGLTTSGFLWGRPSYAAHGTSCNVLDPNGGLAGPCGPSPLCSGHHCDNGSCVASLEGVTWRAYAGCDCIAPSHSCWTENCCNTSHNSETRCCDCCEHDGPGGSCCGCQRTDMHKCICRRTERVC